ncbi:patatin-like phospholipase family protein [Phenylobacterium sp.]|uniref:patatin-like phospholipase family protein n=1 Tax=Phenylobacterium sp. TaxID=1871053 RepID=UPI0027316C74|nr:patatin-like phospholipase family protein [Phenylobacterium sp.]MDP1987996.1 patatin-like phospholipase family protein [Phenylobacterium sp.]
MARLPDLPNDTALAQLFFAEQVEGDATWFSLPGGGVLFEAGEEADQLYFLRAGRLGVFRHDEGQEPEFLGVIRPGEPAGEMSLLAGTAHSARVVALRDSEIFALPREMFLEAAEEDPGVMLELAQLVVRRTRRTKGRQAGSEPSVYGFVTVGEAVPVRPVVDRIARHIMRQGYSVTVVGAEAATAPTEWYSEVERTHDFVLYAAEGEDLGWRAVVARQVDRLFRIGKAASRPPQNIVLHPAQPLQAHQLVDLILMHPRGAGAPRTSEGWLTAAHPARLFHMRRDDEDDAARMARVLTGQSIGLVLSGGGARAYAHVGAVRALRERGVPIDFIGGSSMGAIVAAGLGMGWSDAEADRRIREAFVASSPLDDIAFPLIAMTRGDKVRDRLFEHFGDTRISDLWLPFFAVSSNLTTGAYQVHRSGRLVDALRATIALPGVMPPATQGDEVLVDGAVLNNFPADVMSAMHLGPIIGIDVTRGRSITAKDVARPDSVLRWILSGAWRQGPPIVSLLMRAATVPTGRDLRAARESVDLLVTPDMTGVEIRNWEAYDPAVAAGYAAMIAALDRLETPVTELRRRPAISEASGSRWR